MKHVSEKVTESGASAPAELRRVEFNLLLDLFAQAVISHKDASPERVEVEKAYAAVAGEHAALIGALKTMRAHFSCSAEVRAQHDPEMALRILEAVIASAEGK